MQMSLDRRLSDTNARLSEWRKPTDRGTSFTWRGIPVQKVSYDYISSPHTDEELIDIMAVFEDFMRFQ